MGGGWCARWNCSPYLSQFVWLPLKCSTNCLTINPMTEHQASWMAAAIQALCSLGFTSSLCNSFTLRHFAFSWKTEDSPSPPCHTLLWVWRNWKRKIPCASCTYVCVTRRGKLENKNQFPRPYLTATTKHVTLCAIKVRPFSPDYSFSTSSSTILVYRECATNTLETMQSNREPALEWKQWQLLSLSLQVLPVVML